VRVNGKDVLVDPSKGINVVVLEGSNHEVIFTKTYDTATNADASAEMVTDSANAPPGSVVIATVKGSAAAALSKGAMDIFGSMGSKEIYSLNPDEGWLFLGVAGTKTHVEKRGG